MKKIVNFDKFVNEAEIMKQASLASLLSDFTRMYVPATKHAPLGELQFLLVREDRDWDDPSETAEIGTSHTQDGSYSAEFHLDNVKYKMEIDFSMTFSSQQERDVPDVTMLDAHDKHDLGLKLEKLDIKRISVQSSAITIDTKKLAESTKEIATQLLLGVMKGDFDVLGSKIGSITH